MLIFVTGLPGTGKTTLASTVGERFGLPVFSKDAFKEGMMDAACPNGDYETVLTRDFSRLLSRFAIDCLALTMEQCARAGVSAVFEANFTSALFSPRIAAVRTRHPFSSIQVHLTCYGDTLLQRFIAREGADRHPGHSGLRFLPEFEALLRQGTDEPLTLEPTDPLIEFDTTDFARTDFTPLFQKVNHALIRENI